jgi:hypothetical protein
LNYVNQSVPPKGAGSGSSPIGRFASVGLSRVCALPVVSLKGIGFASINDSGFDSGTQWIDQMFGDDLMAPHAPIMTLWRAIISFAVEPNLRRQVIQDSPLIERVNLLQDLGEKGQLALDSEQYQSDPAALEIVGERNKQFIVEFFLLMRFFGGFSLNHAPMPKIINTISGQIVCSAFLNN